jgi:hypothetical protein
MNSAARRWDIDERGIGVADAAYLKPDLERLAEAGARAGWVAEDPHAHLLPHLTAAASRPGSPWILLSADPTPEGVYELVARHAGTDDVDAVRDGIAWLSAIAESAFFVRRSGPRTIECVTGMLDGDSEFASHGHTLRLRIELADAAAVQ